MRRTAGVLLALALGLALALPPLPAAGPNLVATGACPSSRTSVLDLNGDGYDDAVVGDPDATVNGQRQAGAVVVLFGDADCRIGEGPRRVLTQRSAGIPGTAEAGDRFGWSVAVDDLDDDGQGDLVVGSPGEDVDSAADSGSVMVITFAAGPAPGVAVSARTFSELFLTRGLPRAGDQLGYAVATADDARDDSGAIVAAGAPGRDVDGAEDAGAVLTFGYDHGWHRGFAFRQGATGFGDHPVPGTPEAGDRFGASVLMAELHSPATGDARAGLQRAYVIGAPGDTVRGRAGAGSVTVAFRESWAVAALTQDSPGVPGTAEAGDGFGSSLAAHRPATGGAGSLHLLAVGAPGEDVGEAPDAGAVTLLGSEPGGLRGRSSLTQDSPGIAGRAEPGDHFGRTLALHAVAGSPDPLLLVGAPEEDISGTRDAGLVQSLAVTPRTVRPLPSWTEDAAGFPGRVAAGHRFGSAVRVVSGRSEQLVAISSRGPGAGAVFLVGTDGHTRSWVPGKDGVPRLAGSDRFGWSVAGAQGGGG